MQKRSRPKRGKKKPVKAKKSAAITKKPEVGAETLDVAQQARFNEYMSPEFTQRLLDHMHRAKIAALRENTE